MARRLGIRPEWLASEIDAGRLPAARVGGGYVCDPEAVEAALHERAQSAEGVRHA